MHSIVKHALLLFGAALTASGLVQGTWPIISLPKNLPTKMKSVYDPSINSSFGYDGNYGGALVVGVSCIHSAINELLPWWMLDMLQTYIVKGVAFYQRTDNNYQNARSQFVTIGISSQQLVWNSFNASLFETCFFKPDPVVVGVNPLNFTCYRAISGRFLTVYHDLNNKNITSTEMLLNFCEIDVYAYQKSKIAAVQMGLETAQPVSTSASQVALLKVRSEADCVFLCIDSLECVYIMVSYDASTGVTQCYLLRSFSLPDNSIGGAAAKFYSFNLV